MRKRGKKLLAMMLALSMTMNMISIQAFADEPVVEAHVIQNEDGTTTEQTITTTTTTNPETGNVMLEVKIEENVTKDENGNVLKESTVEDGFEKTESTEEVKPGQDVPSVEVTIQYETNEDGTVKVDSDGNPIPKTDEAGNIIISGSVEGEPVTETTGDINSEEGQTTTTTTTVREVDGTLEIEEDFQIIPNESKLECPVGPEDYEGKEYNDNPGTSINDRYFNDLLTGYNKDSLEEDYVDPKPDASLEEFENYDQGYDLTWTGYGDVSNAASALYAKDIVYLTDENGEVIYENGFPVVDMEKTVFLNGRNGKSMGYGMVASVGQFALRHENGEYFYAYCMDASTGASPDINKWYNIRNLEDAIESEENPDGYLTEDEAAMIRAIATNGYWGTEDGRGSVDSLKELLKQNYNEDSKINVRYPGSNKATEYDIWNLIDNLTEAEALTVTQAAIWTYANNGDVTYDQRSNGGVVTNASVIGVLSALKCYNGGTNGRKISWLNEYTPAKDGESDARMQALYYCLLNLDPIYADGELREDSTVIPNENVINDVALVIKDKVDDENVAANFDDNDDNDVYNTELSFQLAFVPGEKDEMYVCLMDSNNQFILDADGQPIKKLLASEDSEKSGNDVIKPVNGVYTLTGLKLSENSDFEFDLRLEGTQYLEEGVYIYQAAGGRGESQTLVGLAKGEQKVVVSNKMTISFDVDEENHVVAERKWHTEDSKEYDPQPNNPGGGDGNNGGDGGNGGGSITTTTIQDTQTPLAAADTMEIFDENVPLSDGAVLNIEDAPIPLAVLPMTGDMSVIWMLISLISGLGLAGVSLADWKKKRA